MTAPITGPRDLLDYLESAKECAREYGKGVLEIKVVDGKYVYHVFAEIIDRDVK